MTQGTDHKNTTIGIAATLAAIVVGLVLPQQALAYHHHNLNNGIKVNQQIDQLNACDNGSVCLNDANNTADIDR